IYATQTDRVCRSNGGNMHSNIDAISRVNKGYVVATCTAGSQRLEVYTAPEAFNKPFPLSFTASTPEAIELPTTTSTAAATPLFNFCIITRVYLQPQQMTHLKRCRHGNL
ncbi:unnamed protein product, partial [Ceratitis capitata]